MITNEGEKMQSNSFKIISDCADIYSFLEKALQMKIEKENLIDSYFDLNLKNIYFEDENSVKNSFVIYRTTKQISHKKSDVIKRQEELCNDYSKAMLHSLHGMTSLDLFVASKIIKSMIETLNTKMKDVEFMIEIYNKNNEGQ